MSRRYGKELARLPETFEWAAETDLAPLRHAVRTTGFGPLYAVGSGGSLTGAHTLAYLHQRYTDTLATVATPLEVSDATYLDAATWLLSAGGSNVDIVAAARVLILREPRQLSVLCGRESSPLAQLCQRHPFVDLLLYPPPSGKDGFLATNSLLGFAVLLARTYSTEFGGKNDWQESVECVRPLLRERSTLVHEWKAETVSVRKLPTILVLHGPHTRIGAIDLESKFTEAALGHVKIADYRNFAHGRHHWLAKRYETSSVLALTTSSDRVLAERTLNLIPKNVPRASIHLEGGPCAAALGSLVAALRFTAWAGEENGIDPGRPGVPAFGRKLYHLSAPRAQRSPRHYKLTARQEAAIRRKAGIDLDTLARSGELRDWQDALTMFLARMRDASLAGIVLDYDGTLVDTRYRTTPPAGAVATELTRICEGVACVAVATGRGASVRRDLRRCLPRALWSQVLVGYYNGAEVAYLTDEGVPDGSPQPCDELAPIAEALRKHTALAALVHQEDRRYQITLRPKRPVPMKPLWELVCGAIAAIGVPALGITLSSHSIDVVGSGVSKVNVVQRLHALTGDSQILAIGDRGRWPGNDYDLLRASLSLGVDEISSDPETCWNIGPPGQRGIAVTLDYLSALRECAGHLRFLCDTTR